ncbi:unnamed protein product [Orchesella dallaii]|uniref:Uncharacterized protein n=1 Tax=Orchesella dallaii TaxID=48710 RepID=A0ABP1PTV4_9HEXA
MSQDPHRFNVYTAPSTSGVPMIGYGGGNGNLQPQPATNIHGGFPINFYFQGRNNNVDIRIFPGSGSNIYIHGSESDDVLRNPERFRSFPGNGAGDMNLSFDVGDLGGQPSNEQQWIPPQQNGIGNRSPGNQLMAPPAPSVSEHVTAIQANAATSTETGLVGKGPGSTKSDSAITRAIRSSERTLRSSKAASSPKSN